MLKYLLEKEFKQILRNRFLPRLILGFPCIILLVMPWAANYEVKNIRVSIADNDKSSYSRRLVQKISSSGYFILESVSDSYIGCLEKIEDGSSDVILEIPPFFGRDLFSSGVSCVMISSDSVNGTRGAIAGSYLSGIAGDFAAEIAAEEGYGREGLSLPTINIASQYRYNKNLDYKFFMVPALMVMILTMLCGFLPALNIVGEKEAGTMEQINVTPVKKHIFILSKLIPYWLIGFIVITIGFLIARFVYGLVPAGNLAVVYFFTAVYITTVSGLGLVISNYSHTMQQSMFVMYFFMMVLILISGLFTPVESMPAWAQYITIFNPLKYFIEVMRSVYLKGSKVADLYRQLLVLSAFSLILNSWAVLSYSKKS